MVTIVMFTIMVTLTSMSQVTLKNNVSFTTSHCSTNTAPPPVSSSRIGVRNGMGSSRSPTPIGTVTTCPSDKVIF